MTVVFETKEYKYTEAFAGSGEVAVASCVIDVLRAQPGSLILIDEPEVSLHPSAQQQLVRFLAQQCIEKKHQIVLATHSIHIVGDLPDVAIKTLVRTSDDKISIVNQTTPYAAFRRIGAKLGGEIRIVVEDRLARALIEQALRLIDASDQERFNVQEGTGGGASILAYHLPIHAQRNDKNTFFFLDGDQQRVAQFTDPASLPPQKDTGLLDLLKSELGVEPHLTADGHDGKVNQAQHSKMCRELLDYARSHVFYLPLSCPEEVVLQAAGKAPQPPLNASSAKAALRAETISVLGRLADTSERIDAYGEMLLAQHSESSTELKTIGEALCAIATRVRPGHDDQKAPK